MFRALLRFPRAFGFAFLFLLAASAAALPGIDAPLYRPDLRFENGSYSPAFVVGEMFSDGSLSAFVQLSNKAQVPKTFILSASSYGNHSDYSWNESVTLQPGQSYGRELWFYADTAKAFGEYRFLFEARDGDGSLVMRRPAKVFATPLGFLGLDSPSFGFPFLPPGGLLAVLAVFGVFLTLAILAFRHFRKACIAAAIAFLALLSVLSALSFYEPARALGFVPVLDAQVHSLKALQLSSGGGPLLSNDAHQQWADSYKPLLAFFAASVSLLSGVEAPVLMVFLVSFLVFVLVPLAVFTIARRAAGGLAVPLASVALLALGSGVLSYLFYAGFWAQALGSFFILLQILCVSIFLLSPRAGRFLFLGFLFFAASALANVGSALVSALALAVSIAVFLVSRKQLAKTAMAAAGVATIAAFILMASYFGVLTNDFFVLETFLSIDLGRVAAVGKSFASDAWNHPLVLFLGIFAAVMAVGGAAKSLLSGRHDLPSASPGRPSFTAVISLVVLGLLAAYATSSLSAPHPHVEYSRLLSYPALLLPVLSCALVYGLARRLAAVAGDMRLANTAFFVLFAVLLFVAAFVPSFGRAFGVRQYSSNFYSFYFAAPDPELNSALRPVFFLRSLRGEPLSGFSAIVTRSVASADIRGDVVDLACIDAALATGLDCINACGQDASCRDESVFSSKLSGFSGQGAAVFTTARLSYPVAYVLPPGASGSDKTYYLYKLP